MAKKTPEGVVLLMKALWSQMYQAPTNDDRLLSLTLRELSEELSLRAALVDHMSERTQDAEEQDDAAWLGEGRTLTREQARKIADTPQLTGNSWYDEQELRETSQEHQFAGHEAHDHR